MWNYIIIYFMIYFVQKILLLCYWNCPQYGLCLIIPWLVCEASYLITGMILWFLIYTDIFTFAILTESKFQKNNWVVFTKEKNHWAVHNITKGFFLLLFPSIASWFNPSFFFYFILSHQKFSLIFGTQNNLGIDIYLLYFLFVLYSLRNTVRWRSKTARGKNLELLSCLP